MQKQPAKPGSGDNRQESDSLDDLVRRITPDDRHDETETGKPAGKELWCFIARFS